MKFAVALSLFLLLAWLPATAGAGASCWTIDDPDQRAYCRAIETNSAGQCSAIADFSLRETCRVRVGANPDRCKGLRSEWERQKCRDAGKAGK